MLRQALNRPCITLEGLARRINTKKSAISRIENHAEEIKLSTLEKFVHALGKQLTNLDFVNLSSCVKEYRKSHDISVS